ncbi:PIR protein [Plasmodium malariae]|uniref:PIR protein n=1 Tax=Plasmodium malariae TaxID=5858 RepID=A0A1D3JIU0_PLAMA|nr:PIR protein [Plasmodium malariae]SBT86374.1 PIR protein [Plasmodium malariae]
MNDLGLSLPSTVNYDILNKKKDYESSVICDTLEGELSDYKDVFEFCENYTGIIKYFKKLSFSGEFANYPCIVVKFWLYDRLFNLRNKRQEVTNIENIISKIKAIIKVDDKIEGCNLFDLPYSKEDFDIMKSLYDYATNYSTITAYLRDNSYICNQYLKDYINTNDEIYINKNNNCNYGNKGNIGYCKVFEYLKDPYIKLDLSTLSCRVKGSEASVPMERHHELPREEGPPENLKQKHSLPFSNIIMAVIFPLLGIFFFLFILCKFTPFKSWLKSHLLKKKIIQFYEDEEYIQEHLNKNYRTDRRHICYHPL